MLLLKLYKTPEDGEFFLGEIYEIKYFQSDYLTFQMMTGCTYRRKKQFGQHSHFYHFRI